MVRQLRSVPRKAEHVAYEIMIEMKEAGMFCMGNQLDVYKVLLAHVEKLMGEASEPKVLDKKEV